MLKSKKHTPRRPEVELTIFLKIVTERHPSQAATAEVTSFAFTRNFSFQNCEESLPMLTIFDNHDFGSALRRPFTVHFASRAGIFARY
jgi:hypothetical protein